MIFTKTCVGVRSTYSRLIKRTCCNRISVCARCFSSDGKTSVETEQPRPSSLSEEKQEIKGPFIKNLFCGVFDGAILEYPEYSSMEFVKDIKSIVHPVEEYFLSNVDSKIIDEKQGIPKDILNSLKEHNLFSLLVPQKWGGLELDQRCYARYCEAVGSNMSISTTVSIHNTIVNALLSYGTESQKNKYLPKLISGDMTIGFSMLEKPNLFDAEEIDTYALTDDNGDWVINGKKIWVANGYKADTYLVFAKTWLGSTDVNTDDSILSVFLIDRNTPGIKCGLPLEQLGTRGVEICDVSFDNVIVKNENLLGEVGAGFEIAFRSLSGGRLGAAASAVGFLKNLFAIVTDHTIHTTVSHKPLHSYEYVKRQLGWIAADIYALESMVYLTAGIKDMYNNPDLSVEESIVKIYSTEKIIEIVDRCVDIIGGSSYIKGSPLENFIRDSRSYLIHDIVPTHVTKVYIASLGLQHAGMEFRDDIKKNRNPFDFPGYIIKTMWKERNLLDDDLKTQGLLRLQLHPSLSSDADKLELCVVRLEAVVKNLLRRWGIEIIDRQMDLTRLADCAVSMYAMTAVLARASRSYCIGLANSDTDIATASVLTAVHSEKVKGIISNLLEGPVQTCDAGFLIVGEKVTSNKGYFYEHPLERNY